MGNLIDQNKKISHEKMALMIENSLLDDRKRSKLRLPADIVVDFSEWCYPPIVQSGGNYDLKPSAASDTSLLHAGTIVVSFGVRYKSYCSNVARTFMINPEKEKEKNYEFLLKLQAHVLTLIKDGVQCNQVYDGAVAYIQEHRPDLVASFTKNCGFGVFVYNSDWNRIPRISIFAFE
jgi:nucleosome binding factor SPN SPT16 subunit